MLISVILPTRDRLDDLHRALLAIAAQTHRDFEVIVVDDGSSNTARQRNQEFVATFGARFKFVYLGVPGQRGVGLSSARNIGIEKATGQLLAFCGDDDFWCTPDYLASVSASFESRSTLDMYVGYQKAVHGDGWGQPDWLLSLCKTARYRQPLLDGVVLATHQDLCAAGGFPQLNTFVLRRSVVERIGRFWSTLTYEGNSDFFWRALDQCQAIAFNPAVVAQHHAPHPAKTANAKHTAIIKLAVSCKGDLLRKVCLKLVEQQAMKSAYLMGRQALAARFSIKWATYVLWLLIKQRRSPT
ncbi:glycosyltransferase family 2 protein [Rhodoferax sp. U11-2br]|uniref:glycosyltransferase family 2 protein n=1 Tax=Rhodoferax sp. U11-2br TaxID=2838878 RepID=UPI001BECCC13|nr:glycosyltransferase family 2 protein [Rhodoferax sp. U11-2br]MBT3067055.1 glycosyltransferase family 2 protein [Rhodoferax sp. U11-2br]